MIPLMCPIYKTFSHESCQASLMGSFQTRPGSPCWLRAKFLQSALSPASSPSCTWSSWGWWAGRRGWGCWRRSWSRWDRTWCSWGWDAARWRQSWGTPPRPPPPPSGSPRPSPRRLRCTASHFRNRTWPAQHCIKDILSVTVTDMVFHKTFNAVFYSSSSRDLKLKSVFVFEIFIWGQRKY